MPQQGYLSTDPRAGTTAPPPATGGYLSTNPGDGFLPPASQSTTPAPPAGFLDRLKAMSPRQWAATGIRGLSGILSSEGTFVGAGIGGAGEGLAQWVGGESFNPAAIATQSALSAIPLGRVFKGAASLAKDAGFFEKLAAASTHVGGNTLRGAALGAGQTAASDIFGEGRMPTAEELKFGAIVGGAGGGAMSAASRAYHGRAPHVPGEPRLSNEEATRVLSGPEQDLGLGVRMPRTEVEGQNLILGADKTRGLDEVNDLIRQMPTEPATGSGYRPQEQSALEADTLGDRLRGQRTFDRGTGQGSFGFGAPPHPLETGDSIDRLLAVVRDPESLTNQRVAIAEERAAMGTERDRFSALEDLLKGRIRRLEDGQPNPESLAGASQRPLFTADEMSAPRGGAPVNHLTPDPWETSVKDLTGDVPHSGEVPEGATVGERVDLGQPDEGYLRSFGDGGDGGADDPIRQFFRFGEAPYDATGKRQLLPEEIEPARLSDETPSVPSQFRPAGEDPIVEWLTRNDRNRSLPWQERQTAIANDERFAHLQGSESGFVTPGAAYYLGGGAAGAALGPVVDQGDDPRLAAFGGAGLGLLGVTAARNPAMLERLRFSNLFSGAAIPKSFLGNIGALGAYSAENPGRAASVLRELFTPETGRAAAQAYRSGAQREFTAPHVGESVFDIPGKLIGAPDAAARNVMERAGATADEAGQFTLSGKPSSAALQDLVRGVSIHPSWRQILPVARTAANLVERGMERTPLIGQLPAVRAWSNATPKQALTRQALGALAMGGGAAAGAATAPGGPLDSWGDVGPYANALMGPYALPGAVGSAVGRAYEKRGGQFKDMAMAAGQELMNQLPLPSMYTNPFSAPGRYVGQFVPFGGATRVLYPDYDKLDMNASFFGPAAAQVPFLNDSLLGRRAPARPSISFGRPR